LGIPILEAERAELVAWIYEICIPNYETKVATWKGEEE
jgi:hypothetical protein